MSFSVALAERSIPQNCNWRSSTDDDTVVITNDDHVGCGAAQGAIKYGGR